MQKEKLELQKEENVQKDNSGTIQEKGSVSQVTEAVTQLHEEKIPSQNVTSEPV